MLYQNDNAREISLIKFQFFSGCSIFIPSPRFVHQLLCVWPSRRRNHSKRRVLEELAVKHTGNQILIIRMNMMKLKHNLFMSTQDDIG